MFNIPNVFTFNSHILIFFSIFFWFFFNVTFTFHTEFFWQYAVNLDFNFFFLFLFSTDIYNLIFCTTCVIFFFFLVLSKLPSIAYISNLLWTFIYIFFFVIYFYFFFFVNTQNLNFVFFFELFYSTFFFVGSDFYAKYTGMLLSPAHSIVILLLTISLQLFIILILNLKYFYDILGFCFRRLNFSIWSVFIIIIFGGLWSFFNDYFFLFWSWDIIELLSLNFIILSLLIQHCIYSNKKNFIFNFIIFTITVSVLFRLSFFLSVHHIQNNSTFIYFFQLSDVSILSPWVALFNNFLYLFILLCVCYTCTVIKQILCVRAVIYIPSIIGYSYIIYAYIFILCIYCVFSIYPYFHVKLFYTWIIYFWVNLFFLIIFNFTANWHFVIVLSYYFYAPISLLLIIFYFMPYTIKKTINIIFWHIFFLLLFIYFFTLFSNFVAVVWKQNIFNVFTFCNASTLDFFFDLRAEYEAISLFFRCNYLYYSEIVNLLFHFFFVYAIYWFFQYKQTLFIITLPRCIFSRKYPH